MTWAQPFINMPDIPKYPLKGWVGSGWGALISLVCCLFTQNVTVIVWGCYIVWFVVHINVGSGDVSPRGVEGRPAGVDGDLSGIYSLWYAHNVSW